MMHDSLLNFHSVFFLDNLVPRGMLVRRLGAGTEPANRPFSKNEIVFRDAMITPYS
jgi:hypothetical protein